MNSAFFNLASASRMSCDFFNCHTKITTRLKDHRYSEIFQQNLQLLASSCRALNMSGIRWKLRAKAFAFSLEAGAFIGATALGNYCEQGNAASTLSKFTRKVARHLHYFSILIHGVALGVLVFNCSWAKLAAVGVTLAIQIFNKMGGPVSCDQLDLALSVSQFAIQCFSDPLTLANFFTLQLVLDLVANKFTSKLFKSHICASRQFAPNKIADNLFDVPPDKSPFKLLATHPDSDHSQLIYSELEVDKRHIRPYLPELEQPNSDIVELIELFESVDWWHHREAVLAKLRADRFWNLQTVDAQTEVEPLNLADMTPKQFYQSVEWAHISGGFRKLIKAIADGKLETSQETQAEALHNCRYILQKLGPLRNSHSVSLADQLLHLAVEASSSCGSSCMVAIRQVFQTLDGNQEQSLDRSVARLLCKVREELFWEFYTLLAGQKNIGAQLLCTDLSNAQIYSFIRSMLALNWGLNAAGCFEELLSCSGLGSLLMLGGAWLPSKLILNYAYTSEKIIESLAEGFKSRELSTVQLFEWARQVTEKWGGDKRQLYLNELAEENPKFFHIPVFVESQDPDISGRIDQRILALLLIDQGNLKYSR